MHALTFSTFGLLFFKEVEEYGVDWDGPIPGEVDMDVEAVVPETNSPISQEDYDELFHTINPLRDGSTVRVVRL